MSKPTPGAKKISPRFARHFGFLCIDEFDDSTLMLIFSKIMLWHLDTRYLKLLIILYLHNLLTYSNCFIQIKEDFQKNLILALMN